MTLFDEKALRRETFAEGPKVRLGDGQEWTFPGPSPSLYARLGADGRPLVAASFSYGKDYLDRLDDMIECEDNFERMVIQLELAAGLLLRNYDLGDRQLRRLICIDAEADPEMWPAIQDVLFGRASPKASADGSGAASDPSASTPTPST